MKNEWFERLKSAIKSKIEEDADESARAISIRAGLNPNYVTQMMEGSLPRVDKFLAICGAVNLDPIEILSGTKQSPKTFKILKLMEGLSDQQRNVFLSMLESFNSAVSEPKDIPREPEQIEIPDTEFLTDATGQLVPHILDQASKNVREIEKSFTDEALFNIEDYERHLKREYNMIFLEKSRGTAASTGQEKN